MRRHPNQPKAEKGNPEKWYVDPDTGCFIWIGAVAGSGNGYGYLKVNGRSVRAHRHFWMQLHGPIPKRKVLHHKCENTRCVNPNHLELTTQKRNIAYYRGR